MPGSLTPLVNFNSGELSERLASREDLARYPNACSSAFNLTLFREGGWARRAGTVFVDTTQANQRARLLGHITESSVATLASLTSRKARWYQNDERVTVPQHALTISNGDFSNGTTGWTNDGLTGSTLLTAATDVTISQSAGTPIGTMTSNGGLAAAFDGTTSQDDTACAALVGNSAWIGKTWTAAKTITGFRVYASKDRGFKGDANPMVTVTLQGSNNAFATSFKTLGSKTIQDYNAAQVDMFDSVNTTTAYTSHRLVVETPGSRVLTKIFVAEVIFYEKATVTGGLEMTAATDGGYASITRSLTGLTVGQEYGIAFDVRGVVADGISLRIGTTSGGTDIVSPVTYRTGWHVAAFLAPASTVHIGFRTISRVKQTLARVRYLSGQIELDTPWADVTLDAIQAVQSGDVQFVVDGVAPMHEIRRYGNKSWSIEQSKFMDGPWREEGDKSIKLVPGAISELKSHTLTASDPIFNPGHVGALFRLATTTGKLNFEPWGAGKVSIAIDDETVYEGNVYSRIEGTGGTQARASGNIPPTHEVGAAYDGKNDTGVLWKFRHRGYGVVLITGYNSPTSVTGYNLSRLPSGLDSAGTVYWREASFSPYRGQPNAVGLTKKNRLVLAEQRDEPGRLFFSRTNDYLNFEIGTEDDSPITATVRKQTSGRGDVSSIKAISTARDLLLLTTGGPVPIWSGRDDLPLTFENIQVREGPSQPSAATQAVATQGNTLYIGANKNQLYEASYSPERDQYIANDLTLIADHISSANGFEQIVAQELPWTTVWARRADGRLASLIYDIAQGVAGWARHRIAGSYDGDNPFVESLAVMPGSQTTETKDRDVLYMTVARTINGATVRTIEYMGSYLRESNQRARHVATDASVVYRLDGVATTVFTGLDHLEGQTVGIYADGRVHPSKVVANGQITTNYNVSEWCVIGLKYAHEYISLKFPFGAAKGSAQGRRKRISRAVMVLRDAGRGEYGNRTGNLTEIPYPEPRTDDPLAGGLFTGEVAVGFQGNWERDPRFRIRASDPTNFECTAIIPETHVNV